MRLLDQLLDLAVRALPRGLAGEVVVFGSAPMVFAGWKPDVSADLDLFVSDGTFAALERAGFASDVDDWGSPRLWLRDRVEVVSRWPGTAFDEVSAAAAPAPGSRGLRVAALEHVLAFKIISEREKDAVEAGVLLGRLPRAPAVVALAWQAAASAGDVGLALRLSTEDIEVGGPRGSGRGHALVGEWLARAGIELTRLRVFQRGALVVVESRATWRQPSGEASEAVIGTAFEVRGARVSRVLRHDTPSGALAGAGLGEQDELPPPAQ